MRTSLSPVRNLLLASAAFGAVLGLGGLADAPTCARLGAPDDAAEKLEAWAAARCEAPGCVGVEVIATRGCLAKVELTERRWDAYGEELGVFRVALGLRYSLLTDAWRIRERLDERQLLQVR